MRQRRPLPRSVIALGWVSLLTDAASDLIYPLLPAFLLTLGGGATALGWLEGVAETVGAGVKFVAGNASDRTRRRKPLIAFGYGLSALVRPLFAIAQTPVHAIATRAFDRVGKGLRGPPRDAMVADAVDIEQRGHAFGFHRMMDNFGGVVGALLAFALLRGLHLELRTVFAVSLVPGLLSVAVVLAFVPAQLRAARAHAADPPEPPVGPLAPERTTVRLSSATWRYLATLTLFTLASSGDLFLMRRLTDLGLDVALVPLAWISLQLAKGATNVTGGRASDRFGRRGVLAVAWSIYGVAYVGFGAVRSWQAGWLLLALYSLYYGLAEGGQRALLADFAEPRVRGRAYGVQLALEGAAALPANLVFGYLYDRFGAATAFGFGGAIALASAVALAVVVPHPKGALYR